MNILLIISAGKLQWILVRYYLFFNNCVSFSFLNIFNKQKIVIFRLGLFHGYLKRSVSSALLKYRSFSCFSCRSWKLPVLPISMPLLHGAY